MQPTAPQRQSRDLFATAGFQPQGWTGATLLMARMVSGRLLHIHITPDGTTRAQEDDPMPTTPALDLTQRPDTDTLAALLEQASLLGHSQPHRTFTGCDGDTPLVAILHDLFRTYAHTGQPYPALRRALQQAYLTGQATGRWAAVGRQAPTGAAQ